MSVSAATCTSPLGPISGAVLCSRALLASPWVCSMRKAPLDPIDGVLLTLASPHPPAPSPPSLCSMRKDPLDPIDGGTKVRIALRRLLNPEFAKVGGSGIWRAGVGLLGAYRLGSL